MNINYEISDEKGTAILEQKCAYHGITNIPTTLAEKEALLNKLLLAEQLQLYVAVEREKAIAPVVQAMKADVEIKAAEDALKSEVGLGQVESVELPTKK